MTSVRTMMMKMTTATTSSPRSGPPIVLPTET